MDASAAVGSYRIAIDPGSLKKWGFIGLGYSVVLVGDFDNHWINIFQLVQREQMEASRFYVDRVHRVVAFSGRDGADPQETLVALSALIQETNRRAAAEIQRNPEAKPNSWWSRVSGDTWTKLRRRIRPG